MNSTQCFWNRRYLSGVYLRGNLCCGTTLFPEGVGGLHASNAERLERLEQFP